MRVASVKAKSFKELVVWQRSMQLANKVYDVALTFPKEEMFGLTSQMRRSAVSVSSNIAEGCQRAGKKEFIQFLFIARGSLAELETQIILAADRKYIAMQDFEKLSLYMDEVSRMLMGLIKSLQ